jgi:hypothetical protein
MQQETNLQKQSFVKYRQRQRRRKTGAELKIKISIVEKISIVVGNMINIPYNKELNASIAMEFE